VGVIFPEDVAGGAVEDIDLGSISGDGTGTLTVGGDLGPLGKVGAQARAGDFLAVESITGRSSNAVHGALAVEGEAMVVVGLGAFVEAGPRKSFDALLVVIDCGLDVGEAVGFFLGGE